MTKTMKQFYYTTDMDNDNGRLVVPRNAKINCIECENKDEAFKEIKKIFESHFLNLDDEKVVPFETCDEGDYWLRFFRRHDVYNIEETGEYDGIPVGIQKPGEHPCGNSWLVNPIVCVFIPQFVYE